MKVAVCVTTYDNGNKQRTAIATKALESLYAHLVYPELEWLINDDSPGDEHSQDLQKNFSFELFRSYGKGVGFGKNTLLRKAFETTSLVLLTEDDWYLPEPFDLAPHVALLERAPDIGIIRMGYLGGTLVAHYESNEFYNYWRLHRGSDVYIYSGQISLRHKRFYDSVGYHQEGVDAGGEELEMCKRFNGTDNAPDNIWPSRFGCGLNEGPFKNIGMGCSTNGVAPT